MDAIAINANNLTFIIIINKNKINASLQTPLRFISIRTYTQDSSICRLTIICRSTPCSFFISSYWVYDSLFQVISFCYIKRNFISFVSFKYILRVLFSQNNSRYTYASKISILRIRDRINLDEWNIDIICYIFGILVLFITKCTISPTKNTIPTHHYIKIRQSLNHIM
jgi:hypothetical protein